MLWIDAPRPEPSAQAPGPDDDWWYQSGSYPTQSGNIVTPETAIRITAVWSCVRILAESIGLLPIHLYRRVDEGKERVTDHPAVEVLRRPMSYLNRMEFVEHLQFHLAGSGRGYAELLPGRGKALNLGGLLPHLPANVRVKQLRPSRNLVYVVRDPEQNREYEVPQERMLHLRGGMMQSSIEGLNPVAELREALGGAKAASDYGSRFFRNDAQPRGVLKVPGKLKDEETADEYKRRWNTRYGGVNQQGIAVLSQGLEFEQIGLSNEDAQFLETRGYNAKDIARIWRIPAHMINEMSGAIKANVEQMGLEFVVYTLMAWLTRWELTLTNALLTPSERETMFFEFKVDAFMRGELRNRYQAFRQATGGAAWMTPDEVRALENMSPIPGGDRLPQPLNMSRGPGPDGQDREVEDAEREEAAEALVAEEIFWADTGLGKMNPGRFLNAARVHYDRLAARASLDLDVSLDAARTYAEKRYAQLLAADGQEGMMAVLETWKADGADTIKETLL